MRLLRSSHFWILVCLLKSGIALAASTIETVKPELQLPIQNEKTVEDPDSISRKSSTQLAYPEGFTGSQPKNQNSLPRSSRVIYKEPAGGVHVGGINGYTLTDEESTQPFSVGAFFVLDNTSDLSEFEINLQSDRVINIALSRRWNIQNYEEWMEPYWTAGLVNYMDSKAGFAGLVNLSHLKVRAAFGLADLFEMHNQYYTEIGAAWGLAGALVDLRLGCTFSF